MENLLTHHAGLAKPLENLARVFVQPELSAVDSAIDIQKAYQLMADTGAEGLKELINAINAPRVVLMIDQFEEIFTRCDKIERQIITGRTRNGAVDFSGRDPIRGGGRRHAQTNC